MSKKDAVISDCEKLILEGGKMVSEGKIMTSFSKKSLVDIENMLQASKKMIEKHTGTEWPPKK